MMCGEDMGKFNAMAASRGGQPKDTRPGLPEATGSIRPHRRKRQARIIDQSAVSHIGEA